MKSLAKSKKGSSLVLGMVLLVIVTLVGGIFFYNYVMGSINFSTNAYVNQIPALLRQALQIAPATLGKASIGGSYSQGTTYNVKLAGLLGVLITFDVTF